MKKKIFLLGEAWGEEEERQRLPFVGPAGWELNRLLSDAGIERSECYVTNVFNLHPPGNDLETLCGTKTESILALPALTRGKFLRTKFAGELERLGDELIEQDPNIVICLGNTAAWALLGVTGIKTLRGTITTSSLIVSGLKILPTYHPAAILRQWDLRPITVLDLIKAKRESEFPEIIRPAREIWIEPTLGDLDVYYEEFIIPSNQLSIDIETAGTEITCIGFAPNARSALVVPFVDRRRTGGSYWPTFEDERYAWHFVRKVLQARTPKLFQNGLYDIGFLWRSYGLRVVNPVHDTMLLHHALYPEMLKGLGFLGSVYTNEPAWKTMTRHTETIKRDE